MTRRATARSAPSDEPGPAITRPFAPAIRLEAENGTLIGLGCPVQFASRPRPAPDPGPLMCKDVLLGPPLEIKQDTMRQEFETGLRQFLASLASQHRVEAATQGVQVHNVGGGIPKLLFGQSSCAPIRALLLLG